MVHRKEKAALDVKLRANFYTGLKVEIGKGYNCDEPLVIVESERNSLKKDRWLVEQVPDVAFNIGFVPDTARLQITETLLRSDPFGKDDQKKNLFTRQIALDRDDYYLVKADDVVDDVATDTFYFELRVLNQDKMKMSAEQRCQQRIAVDRPGMVGPAEINSWSSNLMFLHNEDAIRDKDYIRITVPNYQRLDANGKPGFNKGHILEVVHQKLLNDARLIPADWIRLQKNGLQEQFREKEVNAVARRRESASVKIIQHHEFADRYCVELFGEDARIVKVGEQIVFNPDAKEYNEDTLRQLGLFGLDPAQYRDPDAARGPEAPASAWCGRVYKHDGRTLVLLGNDVRKVTEENLRAVLAQERWAVSTIPVAEDPEFAKLMAVLDHLEDVLEYQNGSSPTEAGKWLEYVLDFRPFFLFGKLHLATASAPSNTPYPTTRYHKGELNLKDLKLPAESHDKAYRQALECPENVFLLKGPPATGKTNCLANMINIMMRQVQRGEKKVAGLCQTNVATKTLAERVIRNGREHFGAKLEIMQRFILLDLSETHLRDHTLPDILEPCTLEAHKERVVRENPVVFADYKAALAEKKLRNRIEDPALKRNFEVLSKKLIKKIGEQVLCVFSTLANCHAKNKVWSKGKNKDDVPFPWDAWAVVVDEASQANQLYLAGALLVTNPVRLVLGGDEKQLAPYVEANCIQTKWALEVSLFKHGVKKGEKWPVVMLDLEFRSPPWVYAGTNMAYYGGYVSASPHTLVRERFCEIIEAMRRITFEDRHGMHRLVGVCHFFDITNSVATRGDDTSSKNEMEAEFFVLLIRALGQAGIPWDYILPMSGYLAQRDLLEQSKHWFPGNGCEPSSIDSSQGAEREIVLLSGVVTWVSTFMKKEERANVGSSRGRESTCVAGRWDVYVQESPWREYLEAMAEANPGYRIRFEMPVAFYVDGQELSNEVQVPKLSRVAYRDYDAQMRAVAHYAIESRHKAMIVSAAIARFGEDFAALATAWGLLDDGASGRVPKPIEPPMPVPEPEPLQPSPEPKPISKPKPSNVFGQSMATSKHAAPSAGVGSSKFASPVAARARTGLTSTIAGRPVAVAQDNIQQVSIHAPLAPPTARAPPATALAAPRPASPETSPAISFPPEESRLKTRPSGLKLSIDYGTKSFEGRLDELRKIWIGMVTEKERAVANSTYERYMKLLRKDLGYDECQEIAAEAGSLLGREVADLCYLRAKVMDEMSARFDS
ncbi:hypothetical protein H2198_004145 [Neophaeococcomyces mojaviensis]|uniref:Uncharacterized protein n=1 Tax=Neophaeococcomyces mojaviensis TaxID=3383035 RepID=A0ACC3A9S3_9EURO|nr:hypothetical protein H2198_004145 [Knufia sp. JES_112]